MSDLARRLQEQWQMFHNDPFYQDQDFLRAYTVKRGEIEENNCNDNIKEKSGKKGNIQQDGRYETKYENQYILSDSRAGQIPGVLSRIGANVKEIQISSSRSSTNNSNGDDIKAALAIVSSSSSTMKSTTTGGKKKKEAFVYNPHVQPFIPAMKRENSSIPTDADEKKKDC
eukprot:CAMPEP_0185268688 /NCGR_PEP_ID=MMETSP1359-20130426/37725_1 /TAXON_ID=552665 /ORGANISM="Bigelowiella longifila, Strain CCMP242" /LENGTH=170 /DNA_ID=CAMNT_0027859539 /DNA_START=23 /DNA_END=535 /DNA_ORIENTATION=+